MGRTPTLPTDRRSFTIIKANHKRKDNPLIPGLIVRGYQPAENHYGRKGVHLAAILGRTPEDYAEAKRIGEAFIENGKKTRERHFYKDGERHFYVYEKTFPRIVEGQKVGVLYYCPRGMEGGKKTQYHLGSFRKREDAETEGNYWVQTGRRLKLCPKPYAARLTMKYTDRNGKDFWKAKVTRWEKQPGDSKEKIWPRSYQWGHFDTEADAKAAAERFKATGQRETHYKGGSGEGWLLITDPATGEQRISFDEAEKKVEIDRRNKERSERGKARYRATHPNAVARGTPGATRKANRRVPADVPRTVKPKVAGTPKPKRLTADQQDEIKERLVIFTRHQQQKTSDFISLRATDAELVRAHLEARHLREIEVVTAGNFLRLERRAA